MSSQNYVVECMMPGCSGKVDPEKENASEPCSECFEKGSTHTCPFCKRMNVYASDILQCELCDNVFCEWCDRTSDYAGVIACQKCIPPRTFKIKSTKKLLN